MALQRVLIQGTLLTVTQSDDPFHSALSALLAPLAQAMVARGVTIGAATEAMKHALLDAALEAENTDAASQISDSRISLRTGLHRKDVKRLRQGEAAPSARKSVNGAAMAISHWANAPEYLDGDGAPRVLVRHGDRQFDELVKQAKIDLPAATVLDALIEQGAVETTADGYRLLTHSYVPSAGSDQMIAAYEATLEPHLDVATENLLAPEGQPRKFDRIVRYSHLSDRAVAELEALATKLAQSALETVNAQARALQAQSRDADQDSQTGRFAFGAYVRPTPSENKE